MNVIITSIESPCSAGHRRQAAVKANRTEHLQYRRAASAPLLFPVMWVYCITDETAAVTKVGFSRSPDKRLKGFSVNEPQAQAAREHAGVPEIVEGPLRLVKTWQFNHMRPGAVKLMEQLCHHEIRQQIPTVYRCGEWFAASPLKIIDICNRRIADTLAFWAGLDVTDPPPTTDPCAVADCPCHKKANGF